MNGFDWQPRTRLVFGAGCADRVGELARELGAQRVLLVTDRGIVGAGHAAKVERALTASGVGVTLFDQVCENPTTGDVDRCVAVARQGAIELIVGLGGGSSMDTAKGCNLLLTNGGQMRDYWGVGKATRPMLPLIAIPTTAGTGSECQSAALIADETTHQKMACLDPKAAARVALLDPALTLSQPARVTAVTGIDAIAHAVETAVTSKRTQISLIYSREAFKLLAPAFSEVMARPAALEARADMLLGAAFGGLAIEYSMLGAAHSAANPLTAHHGIVHGHAVGLLLPWVVRFNGQDPETARAYANLAVTAGLASLDDVPATAVETLAQRLEWFLKIASLPASLAACNVARSAIPALAAEAARQWTAGFNPRPITAADFERLYTEAFEPRG